MRHGVSSGRRRRLRVHGGRAAPAARRPPRDRGRARHGRLERGRRGRRAVPVARAGVPEHLAFAPLAAADLAGLDLVFCALPHGASQASAARPRRPRRPRRSTSAPTSGCRADVYARWYGEAHAAPELLDRFAYGLRRAVPRRDRRRTRTSPRPGCYPTAVSLALRAAARARSRRAADHRRRGVGRVGRRSRAQDHEPVLGGERERLARTACSRTVTPRRWSRRSRRSRGEPVQVLFTPHLVPMTRGILATCYARPAADGPVDGAPARALPRVLRRRSVRRRGRRAVGDQGDVRRQRRARHRALRRAHRARSLAIAARGQPREGRVGPDDPGRQPRCSACPKPTGCCSGSSRESASGSSAGEGRSRAHERHRGEGVRGRWAGVRHQGVGRARPRDRRDRRSPRR